jgi:hypothetical protein
MNNQFWMGFFRKDLNLPSYWWHRLSKVLFFTTLIISNILAILWSLNQIDKMLPQWKLVESVDSRLSNKLTRLTDLKKYGEEIESNYSDDSDDVPHWELNATSDDFFYDVYGALNMHEKIENLILQIKIRGLNPFFQIDRSDVSLDEFKNYILSNKVNYVILDSYLNNAEKIYFLRPFEEIFSFEDKLFFYKTSFLATITYSIPYILLPIPFVLFAFSLFILFYYKIVLYIAFGSLNKDVADII